MTTITMPMTTATATSPPAAASRETLSLDELVASLQKGEEGALEAVIQRTERACYHLALSILRDPDLSKDALQDSYFVVFQRIGQLRETGAFKAWLFRIVSHTCNDILRKRGREVETDLSEREDLLGEGASEHPPSDPSSSVTDRTLIKATFKELPEIDRQALALREICSLSYEEMSRVLSIPIGTVRSRLAKARKRFITAYRKDQKA